MDNWSVGDCELILHCKDCPRYWECDLPDHNEDTEDTADMEE